MKRAFDKYFENYVEKKEPRKNGRGSIRTFEYVGEYYRLDALDAEWNRDRYMRLILMLTLCFAWLFNVSNASGTNYTIYCGPPAMFSMLLSVYLFTGVISGLRVPRDMTLREYRSSVKRVQYMGLTVMIGFLITTAACIYYLVADWDGSGLSIEIITVLVYLICAAIGGYMFFNEKAKRFIVTPPTDEKLAMLAESKKAERDY